MNAPEPFEHLVLPDGVKKLTAIPDTKIPSATSYIIQREDHTIGNILRYQLLRDPSVLFAGYKNPHPLEPLIILAVHTNDSTTPALALSNAIQDLDHETTTLEDRFKSAVNAFKANAGGSF